MASFNLGFSSLQLKDKERQVIKDKFKVSKTQNNDLQVDRSVLAADPTCSSPSRHVSGFQRRPGGAVQDPEGLGHPRQRAAGLHPSVAEESGF